MKTILQPYDFASPSKGVRVERLWKQPDLVTELSNIYSFFGLPDPNESEAHANELADRVIEEIPSMDTSEVRAPTAGKMHELG